MSVNDSLLSESSQNLQPPGLLQMPELDLNLDDGLSEPANDDDERSITLSPLLSIPPSTVRPGDKLCKTCRALGLTPSRFLISPRDNVHSVLAGEPEIHLGRVKRIKKKKKHCPLCRIVFTLLGGRKLATVQNGKAVKAGMGWFTAGPTPGAYPIQRYTAVARVLQIFAYTGKKKLVPVEKFGPPFARLTLLANDAPGPSKLYLMRAIDDQIDFNMVRNALKLCRKWHGSACDKSESFHVQIEDPASNIPHFRLLDTKDNCIVLPPKGCTYVTLSYVWGKIEPLRLVKANVAQLAEPGSLLLPENWDRIPLTIRDAMEVVRRLHLRYLWVDSLCIVQDDNGPGGSKMSAISKMDVVYGGSYIVIIAATGKDANAGLPGLWPGTRGPGAVQLIQELYPGLRVGYNGPRDALNMKGDETTYFERAWTFQEQQLASRCLLFQDGRVVFRCQKTSGWCEDVVFEDTTDALQTEGHNDGGHKVAEKRYIDIKDFSYLISKYSGLSLTDESDIYHALAGMSRHFEAGLEAHLCHGIPDTLFDWCLLWIPTHPIVRRVLAPSWSWSGWRGGITLNMIDHTYKHDPLESRKEIGSRTWIIWYQRVAHGSEDCKLVWSPLEKTGESSEARNFYGSCAKARFPFDCTQTLPTPRKLVGAPTYLEDSHNPSPGSGFLQFWTVSVLFELKTSENLDYEVWGGRYRSGNARAGIFGRNDRELGRVLLDPEWAENNVPGSHEFILLCEGRGDFYTGGETTWKYVMMLLEWHGDWAERVSLGAIELDDFSEVLEQGPIWKEIVLG